MWGSWGEDGGVLRGVWRALIGGVGKGEAGLYRFVEEARRRLLGSD